MPYLTVPEFAIYIRSIESLDQSNEEPDVFVDNAFYERAIESASNEIDSKLGVRFAIPLPMSSHVKTLCYPLAHWWAEKQGEKRLYVIVEYDKAIAQIEAIARGEAALLGVDGKPVGAIGGDASPDTPGIQNVGVFVGQRRSTWIA